MVGTGWQHGRNLRHRGQVAAPGMGAHIAAMSGSAGTRHEGAAKARWLAACGAGGTVGDS